MHLAFYIHHLLEAGARSGLLPVAVAIASMFLEDVTVVFAGVMSSDHYISPLVAVLAVIFGIGFTDFLFYALGSLARTHERLARFVEHERAAPFKDWIHDQLTTTVLTARFLPGFRLPIFLACGFFGVPFKRFAPIVLISDVVWSVVLFGIAYLFGYFTFGWLGVLRWPIALVVVASAFFVGRTRFNKLRALPQ
jgi:membrane protein DedA with SNARE-associated domain